MGKRDPSEYSSHRGTKLCFSKTKVVNGAIFSGREVLVNTSDRVGTFRAAHRTTLLLCCIKREAKTLLDKCKVGAAQGQIMGC